MNKMRMLVINEADTATMTVATGTEVPTLPVSNLGVYNNSRIFRSLSRDLTVIVGTLSNIKLLSAVVLWRHNLTNAATFRLELFGGPDATGELLYDSDDIFAAEQKLWTDWDWRIEPVVSSVLDDWAIRYGQHWFEPVFCQSFRLTIKDPLNPAMQLDITRLYIGRHFEPDVNFSYGNTWEFDSNETQFRTDDGSLFGQEAPQYRKMQFNLEWLSRSDRTELLSAIRNVGRSRDFYISLFPEEGGQKEVETAFACKFTSYPALDSNFYNNHKTAISVEEC